MLQRTSPALLMLPLAKREAHGAAYHVLTFESEEPIEASAGHFAMVKSATWGDAPLLPRPMSLLTAGKQPSILIKVVGEGTRRMAHASSGEPFALLGPLGRPFSAAPEGARPVLVAGGVGVAPLLYLARELCEQRRDPLALYGGRSTGDLPLSDELAAAAELRVATEDGSRGTYGRVTALLETVLRDARLRDEKIHVYTCGPDRMMAAIAGMCSEAGISCEASLETPMACGYGVCLGCPVPKREGGYLYACTDGPCVDAAKVDWHRGHDR